jgi:hypothetical protein
LAPLLPEKDNASTSGLKTTQKRGADHLEFTEDDCNNLLITENCNQIRRKINTFIDNGGMKVGEFQNAIHVSSKSYYTFMKQNGPDKGRGSSVYFNAWRFFKVRELKGISMPKKKKAKVLTANTGNAANNSSSSEDSTSIIKSDLLKIANIWLPGEDYDDVAILDSCDEMRRKINAYLRKDGVTQAEFLRALDEQFKGPLENRPKKLQHFHLSYFRGNNGPLGGNSSLLYYAAFVFFEKLRIADGKGKSFHRLGMEDRWGVLGVDRERRSGYILYPSHLHPVLDEYGILFKKDW